MESTRRRFGQSLLGATAAIITRRKARPADTIEREIEILPDEPIGLIRPELHGQFAEHLGSCVYGGLWVGRDSAIPNIGGYRRAAVEYLRALGVPVLRWPGGCFADDYHWRDGVGPARLRPRSVNLHWGHAVENNSFGTHEFMGLCQMLGAQPYLAGNVGSGSPQELRNWMEYCNFPGGTSLSDERISNGSPKPFDVKFWGVGNEAWGCGGNLFGDEYAEQYRRFATFLSRFGEVAPFLIACGPSGDNQEWTDQFLAGLHGKRLPNGFAMHFYSNSKAPARQFSIDDMHAQFATIPKLEEAILHQRRLMDKVDTKGEVGLLVDEWGVWDRILPEEERAHGRLWQQITMRAAVTTALGLNVFHRQADKLVMCNVAQIVNVLDAMLLTENDQCIRTPSYWAFLLEKPHRGKISLKTSPPQGNATELSLCASSRDNQFAATIINPRIDAVVRVRCALRGRRVAKASARSLFSSDLNAYNSFEHPDRVVPQDLAIQVRPDGLLLSVPPLSVTTILAEA